MPEVDVLFAFPDELHDLDLLAGYDALLSDEERRRNRRFVFPKDRHTDLVTRALVRSVLSDCFPEVEARAWLFERDAYGAPHIVGPRPCPDVSFNLSHTAGLVACAIGRGQRIGVDAEATTRMVEVEALARRFFAPAEAQALLALPEALRRMRFYEYWTLKESYIKARGLGLRIPLAGFSFELDGDVVRLSVSAPTLDSGADWRFLLLAPTPNHRAALATSGPASAVHFHKVVPLRQKNSFTAPTVATSL